MKNILATIILALSPIAALPQNVIYTATDSIMIENILQHSTGEERTVTGERIIAIANEFIGEKYIGGTLEQGADEPLFISCTKLDCTTFVELVLAIAKTASDNSCKFIDVCHNLETIRYRNGKNKGYTSRLHYISWWIADKAKTGIIEDITPQISNKKQPLNINFMSTHPGNYPQLADNPELVTEIEKLEIPYRGIDVNYIPKEEVEHTGHDNIKPGDIIAITTSIPGLDVTHLGFAYYENGKLCLIHASNGKGNVIKDTTPLREYLAKNKRHTGIRVFRPCF
ncbi:MAG: DUF1460 domain-containing protein [Bacteroidaceae bacterium]|nr:DUF1460 domain-containing protein [Bacteroidaceae bacterium]